MKYDQDTLDQIRRGRSRFIAMVATYGLGTFNDSFFRQSAMLLAVAHEHAAMQGWIMSLFALPYLLFASLTGWVADRFSKKHVVIAAKALEVVAMSLGAIGIITLNWWFVMGMVFIMATQSCLFSPALNGSIPELYPDVYVTKANGTLKLVVMLTILAGGAAAGVAMSLEGTGWGGVSMERIGVAVGVVAIALSGLAFSFGVVRRPAADPNAPMPRRGPISTLRELLAIRRDSLLAKVIATNVFIWFAGSLLIQFINLMAQEEFGWPKQVAGYLVAAELIGLAIGGLLVSRLGGGPRWYRTLGASILGMGGLLVVMEMLPMLPDAGGVLGSWAPSARRLAAYGLLGAIGIVGGSVIIPCEAFVQRRPPAGRKGTVLASAGFAVFSGILVSGPLANFMAAPGADGRPLVEPTRAMALLGVAALGAGAFFRRAYAKETEA
ncbi:MAG: MFS transporter [Planctomycetota bacterium]